jgi:hypothetical protein
MTSSISLSKSYPGGSTAGGGGSTSIDDGPTDAVGSSWSSVDGVGGETHANGGRPGAPGGVEIDSTAGVMGLRQSPSLLP